MVEDGVIWAEGLAKVPEDVEGALKTPKSWLRYLLFGFVFRAGFGKKIGEAAR